MKLLGIRNDVERRLFFGIYSKYLRFEEESRTRANTLIMILQKPVSWKRSSYLTNQTK